MSEKNQSVAPATFETLIYPSDLNPNNFYPEAMCFTIRKRIGLTLDEVTGEIGEQYKKGSDQVAAHSEIISQHDKSVTSINDLNPLDKEVQIMAANDVKDKALKGLQDGGSFVAEIAVKRIGKVVSNLGDKLSAKRKNTTTSEIGNIYLNMPQSISNTDSISWNATPLGAIGAMTKGALGGGGGSDAAVGAAVGNAGNIAGAGLGGMLSGLVSKLGIPGGVGVGMLAGAMGGGAVQTGLSATLGMSSNPYEEMMFSGITFRSFSFDFIFRPENSAEINEVSNIIKMFRKYSRPSFAKSMGGNSTMNYPMEFQIEFLTADSGTDSPSKTGTVYKTNHHIPKIKICVCESITTNYTPNSVWAAYKAGAPVAISLSLSFKEKELVMDTDIEDGF
tara:strand:+ start:4947 stop:6119 length:1173 start_codon:yes stop_codon:yes gene_type:complete